MEQQSSHRVLTSGRPAIDADTIQIHILVFRTCCFHPSDTIRKTGIFQVLPTYIMESFRAVGRPHTVDRNDDKAEFYQFGDQMMGQFEILIHMRIVRTGINKLYDRIGFGSIKVHRAINVPPNIRLPVPAFRAEHFRHLPAFRLQHTHIAPL